MLDEDKEKVIKNVKNSFQDVVYTYTYICGEYNCVPNMLATVISGKRKSSTLVK